MYPTLFPDIESWKETLQEGMEIDYLYTEFYNKVNLKNWTIATILEIDQNKQLLIELKGQKIKKQISLRSIEILPLNTFSSDFQWRETLTTDTQVDLLDNRTWSKSTILDTLEGRPDNCENMSKMVKVGLRIYRQDGKFGDKKDYSKKFFGWSETFDTIISVHNPRLRE